MHNEKMEILAYQALERCLAEVSFARLEPIAPSPDCDYDIDMLMNLRLPAGEKRLMIEVKSSGEPRHVREAINQLYRYRESCPEAYGIIITPYVSPRSAGICAAEGVGYVDLAGNCRLEFDQVYIRREGYPNTFAEKRPLRSLYMPKAERILRVMLTYPGRHWKVQEMANEADVSLGQVAKVKALLMDKEWIKVDSEGFCLCDPPALLVEWAENYHFRRSEIREFYSLQHIGELESEIGDIAKELSFPCALTGFSGASRLAPFVRYQRVSAYVATEEGMDILVSKLNLKPVATGANVSLIIPYDEGVFYNSNVIDGIPVVTPVQCYLDVQSMPARGSEAAEAILREVLQPRWSAAA